MVLSHVFVRVERRAYVEGSNYQCVGCEDSAMSNDVLRLVVRLNAPRRAHVGRSGVGLLEVCHARRFHRFQCRHYIAKVPPTVLSCEANTNGDKRPSQAIESGSCSVAFQQMDARRVACRYLRSNFLHQYLEKVFFSSIAGAGRVVSEYVLVDRRYVCHSFERTISAPLAVNCVFCSAELQPASVQDLAVPVCRWDDQVLRDLGSLRRHLGVVARAKVRAIVHPGRYRGHSSNVLLEGRSYFLLAERRGTNYRR